MYNRSSGDCTPSQMWFWTYKRAPRQKGPVVLQAEARAGAALLHGSGRPRCRGGKHVVLQTLNHWRALLGTEAVKTPLAVLQPKPFKCWAWFTVGVYASIQADETFFILAKLHSDKMEILNRLIQPITRCFLKSSRFYPLHCLGFFDVVFLVCFIYLFYLFIFYCKCD